MNKVKRLLIAVDDGPTAEKVARNGFSIGLQLNAEIALISVVNTSGLMTVGGVTTGELAEIIKGDFKKTQQMLVDSVFKDHKVWTFVEKGNPYEIILEVADQWEADMIAIGTHGRTGLSHLLMGSVAEKVIRHSTKPVIVIPSK